MNTGTGIDLQISTGPTRARIAFVLPGGGSLGAVQVGMLEALFAGGIRPDVIVGTSVGSFNGSFIAADPEHGHNILRDVWLGMERRDILALRPRAIALGLFGRHDFICHNDRLVHFLHRHAPLARLQDAKVPIVMTASDLETGQPVAMRDGPAISALLATSALPGVLPPVWRNGRLLVDGGMTAAWPVQLAIEAGADRVYVLETANCTTMQRRRGALAMFERGVDMITDHAVALERRSVFAANAGRVFEIPAPPSRTSILDLSATAELIEAARTTTRRWLRDHQPISTIDLTTSKRAHQPAI